MQYLKITINLLLTVVVIGLAYKLYDIINEPIRFEKEKKARQAVVIKKLEDARKAQLAYRELKGHFADSWEELINTIKNDSIMEIKIIGNPDDTTQVTEYDTIYHRLLTKVFSEDYPIDELPYIPFSGGEKMTIEADVIEVNKVKIPVFEITAPDKYWLKGLNPKYIDPNHALKVGSLTEGKYTGNWE